MSKQDPLNALKQDPQAAALLGDKAALAALLQSDEAKTLAQLFQQMGGDGLKQAAQSAAAGDGAALGQLVKKLQSDPRGAQAMASMDKKLGR